MIRKAKPSEIDKIITITRACATAMIKQGIFQWNTHYPNSAAFKNDFERGELYVLIDVSSEIVKGCITISTLKDLEYDQIDWTEKDGVNYYIHRLAIHPDFQHQGNARKLMDFAEAIAKQQNALSVRLDTFSLNTRNQKFYKNRGYQRLGNIFFPKQSDAPFYCYELVL